MRTKEHWTVGQIRRRRRKSEWKGNSSFKQLPQTEDPELHVFLSFGDDSAVPFHWPSCVTSLFFLRTVENIKKKSRGFDQMKKACFFFFSPSMLL